MTETGYAEIILLIFGIIVSIVFFILRKSGGSVKDIMLDLSYGRKLRRIDLLRVLFAQAQGAIEARSSYELAEAHVRVRRLIDDNRAGFPPSISREFSRLSSEGATKQHWEKFCSVVEKCIKAEKRLVFIPDLFRK